MSVIIGVPAVSKDMTQVRVFVGGAYERYGECSRKALQNAIKNEGKVRMTFTYWKPLGNKEDVIVKTQDEYVDSSLIRYKEEAV